MSDVGACAMILWLLFATGLGLCCLWLVRLVYTLYVQVKSPKYALVWIGRKQ